jgi:hypothetical protein
MSGALVFAFCPPGRATMADPERHDESSQYRAGRGLSRAERLEIISLVAAAGLSECSAWMIPTLECGGLDEDPRTEKTIC